jgi:hypothetical protein
VGCKAGLVLLHTRREGINFPADAVSLAGLHT